MTKVFITIDTELSLGSFRRGVDLETNLAQSIFGRCAEGAFGIEHQIGRFNANGLTAVFLVDPIPAALFGLDMLRRTLEPILEGGHEVQLHIHTEWLPHLEKSPVGDRRGSKMWNFDPPDQTRLIEFATDLLTAAGAPRPIAFRAGNYGADDNTLSALAAQGYEYDTSFNPMYVGRTCRIGLPVDRIEPIERNGVVEIPISAIMEWRDRLRHAQLCALSSWEMGTGLRNAVAQGQSAFTVVLHSFELLTRDRRRANRTNVHRFERLCELLGEQRDIAPTSGFFAKPRFSMTAEAPKPAPGNLARMAHRMAEQLVSTWLYERKWKAA